MKVEGSLEVAELTKKHVDEFIPFMTAIQDESILRARVNALSQVETDDQLIVAKSILLIYDIEPSDDKEEVQTQCKVLLKKLVNELIDLARKTAKATVEASPFFTKRSLVEAYYMLKAYIWQQAKIANTKPRMPFTREDLASLITDDELSFFTAYAMTKMKKQAEKKAIPEEEPEQEDIKKKW